VSGKPSTNHVTRSVRSLITVFSVPKSFVGHVAVIQRNAIGSWKQLEPEVDIVLCGDDDGVGKTARDFGARHIPDVERNEYGTPLLSSVFKAALAASETPFLAYVNADIILFRDLVDATAQLPETHLMVGRRWNLEVAEELDFCRSWESSLRERVKTSGVRASPVWIDYFVLSRHSPLVNVPAFAVGRPYWDNWMIYRARSLNIPVVDATLSVDAVHQNHDYRHVTGQRGGRWHGPEADANAALAGLPKGDGVPLISVHHATHVLASTGIRRAMTWPYLHSRWATRREMNGSVERVARAVAPTIEPVLRIRRRFRNRNNSEEDAQPAE
jgi:hypothetical protein